MNDCGAIPTVTLPNANTSHSEYYLYSAYIFSQTKMLQPVCWLW